MVQKSYFPLDAVAITGSEGAPSHVGTKNLDFSYVYPNVYAPFDCRVAQIYHGATTNTNTTWFESLAPVEGKSFTDYMNFYCGHMNDADFKALGLVKGKTFKQGELIYKAGKQGCTGAHVHISWGRGKVTGTGWYKNAQGNWGVNNQVHMWDAVFLKPGTPILGQSNPAGYAYKPYWAYAETPATMGNVYNQALKTTTVAVNIRELPSTFYPILGQLPLNTVVPITQVSTNVVSGFKWAKVSSGGVIGYTALVGSVDVIPLLTPLEQVQKELAEAKRVIEADAVTISALKNEVLVKDTALKAYVPVTMVLYEKNEGAK